MKRKVKLVPGETYHIFNKSIAGYKIFNNETEYSRINNMLRYYQRKNTAVKFSHYISLKEVQTEGFCKQFAIDYAENDKLVQIIAYCLMPTHLHLILKQLAQDGISKFMGNLLNGYARYFNSKYKRQGPLWQGKFKNVLVRTDEQLLHLTRYIHLNPASAGLVDKPHDWIWSSYREYLQDSNSVEDFCEFVDMLSIDLKQYVQFVEDAIFYQKELAKIKALLFD